MTTTSITRIEENELYRLLMLAKENNGYYLDCDHANSVENMYEKNIDSCDNFSLLDSLLFKEIKTTLTKYDTAIVVTGVQVPFFDYPTIRVPDVQIFIANYCGVSVHYKVRFYLKSVLKQIYEPYCISKVWERT